MSWWIEREEPEPEREPPDHEKPESIAEFESALDLEEERRGYRRVETWIFFRAFAIFMFVLIVVFAREAAI